MEPEPIYDYWFFRISDRSILNSRDLGLPKETIKWIQDRGMCPDESVAYGHWLRERHMLHPGE